MESEQDISLVARGIIRKVTLAKVEFPCDFCLAREPVPVLSGVHKSTHRTAAMADMTTRSGVHRSVRRRAADRQMRFRALHAKHGAQRQPAMQRLANRRRRQTADIRRNCPALPTQMGSRRTAVSHCRVIIGTIDETRHDSDNHSHRCQGPTCRSVRRLRDLDNIHCYGCQNRFLSRCKSLSATLWWMKDFSGVGGFGSFRCLTPTTFEFRAVASSERCDSMFHPILDVNRGRRISRN